MADYRLYFLDSKGALSRRFDLETCTNDTDALQLAEDAENPHGVELWDGSRKIRAFRPNTGNHS